MFGRKSMNEPFPGVRFAVAMSSLQQLACKCKPVIKKDDILDVANINLIQEYVMLIGGGYEKR
jgi:hypothetical protein